MAGDRRKKGPDPGEDQRFDDKGFYWEVCPAGHEIADAVTTLAGRGHRLQGLATKLRAGVEWPRYYPADRPDLFRRFSQTPTTPEGIIEFANKWGRLWNRADYDQCVWAVRCERPEGMSEAETDLGLVENLDDWRKEIELMREVFRIWQSFEANNILPSDRRPIPPKIRQMAAETTEWEFFGPVGSEYTAERYGGNAARGKETVTRCTRLRARRLADLRLNDWVGVSLRWNEKLLRHTVVIKPTCLAGALWLQFARVADAGVQFRPCKVCGSRMMISTKAGQRRLDSQLCSSACRQKDYRRRVSEAKSMKAAGKTVRQIAKHFGTDNDTIKYWLTKEK
jgi:hypothetical protein